MTMRVFVLTSLFVFDTCTSSYVTLDPALSTAISQGDCPANKDSDHMDLSQLRATTLHKLQPSKAPTPAQQVVYYKHTVGGAQCPEGESIVTADECQAAASELGDDWGGIITREDRQPGCLDSGRSWFNTGNTGPFFQSGRPNFDFAICKRAATQAPTPAPTPGPIDCEWSTWSAWGTCSESCGGGSEVRTREQVTTAQFGGAECDGPDSETNLCNTQACPVNCEWGEWTTWETCSRTCGAGEQSRSRVEATSEANGGEVCVGSSQEWQNCNNGECPVDCLYTPWDAWTACSATCGGGQQSRSREIAVDSSNGGVACDGNLSETEECNMQACPTPVPTPAPSEEPSEPAEIYGDPHAKTYDENMRTSNALASDGW